MLPRFLIGKNELEMEVSLLGVADPMLAPQKRRSRHRLALKISIGLALLLCVPIFLMWQILQDPAAKPLPRLGKVGEFILYDDALRPFTRIDLRNAVTIVGVTPANCAGEACSSYFSELQNITEWSEEHLNASAKKSFAQFILLYAGGRPQQVSTLWRSVKTAGDDLPIPQGMDSQVGGLVLIDHDGFFRAAIPAPQLAAQRGAIHKALSQLSITYSLVDYIVKKTTMRAPSAL